MKEYIVLVDESTLEQDELEWFKEQGAKELVRCKDCKYYNSLMGHCKDGRSYPSPEWYCADAEEKDGWN